MCIALSGAPREWSSLALLGPPLLLAAIGGEAPSARRGFLLGLLAGSVANAIALYWVVGLLQVFARFPWSLAVPVASLLWVGQALGMALAGGLSASLMRAGAPGWLVLPANLVVWASVTPSLFPWRLAGTQASWPTFIQMAELGGEPLLDLCVGLFGCGLLAFAQTRRRLPAAIATLSMALPLLYGTVRLGQLREARDAAPTLRVGVVQPNVDIFDKHDRSLAYRHLRDLQNMTRELEDQGADLVVWPETAYPFPISRARRRDLEGGTSVRGNIVRGPVLFGAITRGAGNSRYNSVVAMDGDGRLVGISDKVQLLAFGEYVPFWDYLPPLQERFNKGLTPGVRPRVLTIEGSRVGVLNCYEDVLPAYGRQVALSEPDLLINATNDAWFGDTAEPWLHQAVARLRAVETRRDLVRAVNTGVSSHTLATGEDAVRTPSWTKVGFIAEARLMQGQTPWTRLGDLLSPALAGALLGAAGALGRRRP